MGARPEVFRLNLEQGRFLNPLTTDGTALNVCDINPAHQLFVCGTREGKVEAWDPRVRRRVGLLDAALHAVTTETRSAPSFLHSCHGRSFQGAVD